MPAFPATHALLRERGLAFLTADLASIPHEEALAALLPEERAISAAMAPARRHEFAVGRMLARAALVRLGCAEDAPVARGERGEPLWPQGISGSITHDKHTAAVALMRAPGVSKRAGAYAPGIDLERLERGLSDPAWEHIRSPGEEKYLPPSAAPALRVIVFSCKESLYKALYPACGVYFGFHDACVPQESAALLQGRFPGAAQNVLPPAQAGWVTLVLRCAPGGAFPEGSAFSCHYEIEDGHILTAVVPEAARIAAQGG